jgi:hypothetical protein
MTPKPNSSIKRESTSIKIDPRIWKDAKIEAIREDMDLSELVEKAIEAWIMEQAKKKRGES